MRFDVVLAGVGGQGILTIARILSSAALERGLNVKQAEVHGMSQRGGAVYSHVRLADEEIYSDLIPLGRADMVLAVEPLEALRYVQMLSKDGTVVTSTNAVANIQTYPGMELVLDHIAQFPNHICLDMEKLGRAAGSPMAANVAALGAASGLLPFTLTEFEDAIERVMAGKGERVLTANLRAFRFGRSAAVAYRDGIRRGAKPAAIRQWIETLSPDHLAEEFSIDAEVFEFAEADMTKLSGAEAHAFESLLMEPYEEGRRQLYEHEVYSLIELVGAISPPNYTFVPKGSAVAKDVLERFPGEQVVVKLVSADVIHKTEAHAVSFVAKTHAAVQAEIDRLVACHAGAQVAGVLVVEYIEQAARGLGSELFVGIRATREFGPVIAAGLGGVETEYLAAKMRPGVAVAKAVALDTTPEAFLELFKLTAAYEILSGSVRGHERVVSDSELLRCFRAFIFIARHFCVDRGEDGPDIGELEVNPFAFVGQRLIPLDGRGTLKPSSRPRVPRPLDKLQRLIEPRSIALVGASSREGGLGRLILSSLARAGFPAEGITLIKPDGETIAGYRSVATIDALPEPVDLLILATPASTAAGLIREANATGQAETCIVIAGGAGESDASHEVGTEIEQAIAEGRAEPNDGMVVLGPNCMGVRSWPGRYDTFFIPEAKLPCPTQVAPFALISQSGAFVVSRLSALGLTTPAIAISLGNQADVTVSDLLTVLADRDDLRAVGIYLEGFADLDGLETSRAAAEWTRRGKAVVFYKAGRTESGKSAAAGHTAAVAGDYDVADSALRQSGALMASSFREFSHLLEICSMYGSGQGLGGQVFAVTNAGMESVGMADAFASGFGAISEALRPQLAQALEAGGLSNLVSLNNPLDLTPMAGESIYNAVVCAALADDAVDLLLVSCVPLAPSLRTLAGDLDSAKAFPALAAQWKQQSSKPIVFVADSGALFDPLAEAVRQAGVPVFRSADEAAVAIAKWLA